MMRTSELHDPVCAVIAAMSRTGLLVVLIHVAYFVLDVGSLGSLRPVAILLGQVRSSGKRVRESVERGMSISLTTSVSPPPPPPTRIQHHPPLLQLANPSQIPRDSCACRRMALVPSTVKRRPWPESGSGLVVGIL